MIARVSLEIALRREFDYAIPPEFAGKVDVGSRVQVPFGPRKILGVVTAVAEASGQTNLKPILKLIGEDLTSKEIADRLAISYHTVKVHLKHIYEKLHVRSRTEALIKYMDDKPPSPSHKNPS